MCWKPTTSPSCAIRHQKHAAATIDRHHRKLRQPAHLQTTTQRQEHGTVASHQPSLPATTPPSMAIHRISIPPASPPTCAKRSKAAAKVMKQSHTGPLPASPRQPITEPEDAINDVTTRLEGESLSLSTQTSPPLAPKTAPTPASYDMSIDMKRWSIHPRLAVRDTFLYSSACRRKDSEGAVSLEGE